MPSYCLRVQHFTARCIVCVPFKSITFVSTVQRRFRWAKAHFRQALNVLHFVLHVHDLCSSADTFTHCHCFPQIYFVLWTVNLVNTFFFLFTLQHIVTSRTAIFFFSLLKLIFFLRKWRTYTNLEKLVYVITPTNIEPKGRCTFLGWQTDDVGQESRECPSMCLSLSAFINYREQ